MWYNRWKTREPAWSSVDLCLMLVDDVIMSYAYLLCRVTQVCNTLDVRQGNQPLNEQHEIKQQTQKHYLYGEWWKTGALYEQVWAQKCMSKFQHQLNQWQPHQCVSISYWPLTKAVWQILCCDVTSASRAASPRTLVWHHSTTFSKQALTIGQ